MPDTAGLQDGNTTLADRTALPAGENRAREIKGRLRAPDC